MQFEQAPPPLPWDRDATSERSELLGAFENGSTVRTEPGIKAATRVDEESLQVRRATAQDLASVQGCTSDDRREIAWTGTKGSIVRGLTPRAAKTVEDTTKIGLSKLAISYEAEDEQTYSGSGEDSAKLLGNPYVEDVPDAITGDVDLSGNGGGDRLDGTRGRTSKKLVSDLEDVDSGLLNSVVDVAIRTKG
ncbi:hypothetical protein PTNB85_03699 [Pyrenophora teres f. teres]|uniref:Uncharacterized protein n=1 Tax=Pyrenophora teres f. teres TaxID=97479 RepID=A0A6S6W354_9PLEO|nr:hypothetical protein PTNB85_10582 [Pyrenophora teres f. teres]KAE8822025.1 hypothetical protein PTNB85_10565 [Pyrenophora teres f. teres]KAE8822050.1 hypothetical protein PTNB85_10549 [Pyrenophora teres f. teres]KAE8822074.1 hypothetical protein PTNB85_10533 [Pyrenophora teres f. teres]KAE8822091.1 hypothetical protein HRS9139_10463 [Pyrenophora teres f. teres]